MNTRITFKKGLLAFTIFIVISFVLLSGCLGMSGGVSNPQTAPAVKGGSTGSYGYSGAETPLSTASDNAARSSYSMPAPTAAQNVYTNVNDRKVIMTASVQVEAGDHDKAVNDIRSIAMGAGGYVESSSTWLVDKERMQTSITVKVPAGQYEACLARIKALGKVKSESSSGQDVTRQYVDLSARLKNLQAEEKQLSEIMGMSKNVSEVLKVEKELYRVRGEIESTQAQLNYLGSQVDFSTIAVTVSQPQPVVGFDWGLDTAFREAAHAFVSMIGALVVVTGYLIPLVLYLAIGLAGAYLVLRVAWDLYKKRKNKKAKEGKP